MRRPRRPIGQPLQHWGGRQRTVQPRWDAGGDRVRRHDRAHVGCGDRGVDLQTHAASKHRQRRRVEPRWDAGADRVRRQHGPVGCGDRGTDRQPMSTRIVSPARSSAPTERGSAVRMTFGPLARRSGARVSEGLDWIDPTQRREGFVHVHQTHRQATRHAERRHPA
jgi:hypothetical protein